MCKVRQKNMKDANSVGMNQQRVMGTNYIPTDNYRMGCY